MDELIKLVAQKTGLSEEMAKTAVETVIDFLKKQLPAPIAGRIDDVLEGSGVIPSVEDITQGLGGLLGGK